MQGTKSGLNDTAWDSVFKPVSVMFEEQVTAFPDRIAVTGDVLSYTYKELNEVANRIANALIHYGVKPDDLIMILLPRNIMTYAVNLGILKAGVAFLPVSTEYPDERISYIYRDSGCRYIITTHGQVIERLDLIIGIGKRPLFLEYLMTSPWEENPGVTIKENDLAYCIYTSGSTGRPKGVLIEQKNFFNFLDHNPKNHEIMGLVEHGSVVAATSPFTFDMSIMEEFIPLTSGFTVALASKEKVLNPMLMRDFMLEHKADTMIATPSYVNTLLSIPALREAMSAIRVYDFGAEAFNPGLFNKIKDVNPDAVILNGYGPTETTISCTCKVITDPSDITIGVPGSNVFCYVIDEENREVEKGETGELLICGDGVGRGYLNLPDKTAEAFIEFNGMRGYKTGDLARINENEEIEFHGRKDNQVKYHGLRIELGEIEQIMNTHPSISACSAAVYENRYLCLYYVLNEGKELSLEEIKIFAGNNLAPYMLPDIYEELSELPKTVNQKTDRKALPKPVLPESGAYAPPENETQRKIIDIVEDMMPELKIGIKTDLRDTGLTSLDFMIMISTLGDAFNVAVTMSDFLNNPTVQKLEKLILSKPALKGEAKIKERYKMPPLQQHLYSLMLNNNNADCTLPVVLVMDRDVDIERLRAAVNTAVGNHPVLFSKFCTEPSGEGFMIPCEKTEVEIPVFEITEKEYPGIKSDFVLEYMDINAWPSFFFRLYRTEERSCLFFKVAHHISDGDSVDILFSDIVASYNGKELKPETISMFDIGEERDELFSSLLYGDGVAYYKRLLKDREKWFKIPEDDTGMRFGILRQAKKLEITGDELSSLLKRLKVSENILFMGLSALSQALQVKRKGGKEDWGDVLISFLHSGRNDARAARTFGVLIDEAVVRLRISEEQSFKDFMEKLQTQVFEAMSIRFMPYEEMLASHPDFFDYGIIYQTDSGILKMDGKDAFIRWLSVNNDCPQDMVEYVEADPKGHKEPYKMLTQVYSYDEVTYEISYLVNRYKKERIEAMIFDVERMLSMLLKDKDNELTMGKLTEEQQV